MNQNQQVVKWLVRYELASSWLVWLPLPQFVIDAMAKHYGRLVVHKLQRLSKLEKEMEGVES